MYYAHFGLTRPPFRITPDTTLFFSGAERGSVLEALTYTVMTGEGITKVIGEVGSGKTMLCRMLEEKLPEDVETVYIANPNIDADNILNVIAFEAGFTELPTSKLELMQLLQAWLLECHSKARRVIVLIEEAQGMPIETLEEIRLLSNLETGEDKLLQIVLFGQPELDEKLGRPEIRQLQDRIAHNFYLNPLTRDQIRDYANFRMRQAGYHGPDIFDNSVCRVLATSSKGLVRRVNILADKTLLAAFSVGTTRLLPQHAKIASRDSYFTDARRSMNRLWWFAGAGLAAGFILAVMLAWFMWPRDSSIAVAARQEPSRTASMSMHQPNLAANRQIKRSSMSTNGVAADELEAAEQHGQAAEDNSLRLAEAAPGAIQEGDYSNLEPVQMAENENPGVEQGATSGQEAGVGDYAESESGQLERDAVAALAQSLLENRIAVTRQWLAEAESNLYSIQLMMLKTDASENLSNYLKGLPNSIDLNDIFIYETVIGEDPMLGVLYQQFNSRDAALARMSNMPAAFKRIEPFLLRSVRGLRNEIAHSSG